jgi:hypothetical protein
VVFFRGYRFLGPSLWISLAHKTPSYNIKMLQKIIFDKTAFVKFKISNNFLKNIVETHLKQPKIHRKILTSYELLKSQEKNLRTKSLQTFAKCL